MRKDTYPGAMEFEKPEGYRIEVASAASETHPNRNEDDYFILETGAAGVFDGVGGYEGSEQASALVAEYCHDTLEEIDAFDAPDEVCEQLSAALYQANQVLSRVYGRTSRDIATTALIGAIATDPRTRERYACFAHAGDSRGSVFRDGRIIAATLDHSLARGQAESERRRIQEELSSAHYSYEVDPYDRTYLRERNVITSYLNADSAARALNVDTMSVPIRPGDIVLLTSDGIHDNLTTDEICQILQTAPDPACALVEAAQLRSRESPDATIVLDGEEREVYNFRPKPDDMTAAIIYC